MVAAALSSISSWCLRWRRARPFHESSRICARPGVASYLAVIKTFGDVPSPGIMSFPMAGTTVALDILAPD